MRTTTGSGIAGRRHRRRLAAREREEERDAPLREILRPDAPAVGLDDAAADREPEAGAAAVLPPGAVELLEDARLLARRQPRPVVRDLDRHALVGGRRDDAHERAGGRVLRRVVEEIDQHLLD